ncbi:MAG: Xaa-Pro peptidase family protein [Betaproteobacteria bacterium]
MREELPFADTEFDARLAKVRATMAQRGLDTLVVTSPENIYYLSAFHTAAYDLRQALVVPIDGAPTLLNIIHESEYLVPFRSWIGKRAAYSAKRPFLDALKELLDECGGKRIGIEKTSFFFTIRDYEGLRLRMPTAEFVDGSGTVDPHRAVKSPAEIAYIRQACRVVEAGMRAGVDACAAGRFDTDVAADVHAAIFRAGGDYMSYPPFINAGWYTCLVHNTWSGKQLQPGELVFLEISGVVKRYGAALMRSVAIGKVPEEMERRNRIVHEVVEATMSAIRPGTTSGEVNQACASAFQKHGYTMLKRAGYSMGINFPPGWSEGEILDLSLDNPTMLQSGMVFHIPQPYRMPGEQTVSVSETVLVTETGCEALTQFPRELFRK